MLVASFLVKNLLIDWREGARWFWDCLFDADLASNGVLAVVPMPHLTFDPSIQYCRVKNLTLTGIICFASVLS
jgi:hypothetical protein